MSVDFGEQLTGRGISDPLVLAAMEAVPRGAFVPADSKGFAYEDGALAIGEGQTISQPFIVALMTQALCLEGGEKVLEIGTGSGYQAAVLAEMGCEVYSIERIEVLAERAAEVLCKLGHDVQIRVDDGSEGWPDESPFDRVIVTCAAIEVPDALLGQLRIGGRMVIPVGAQDSIQELFVFEKLSDGGFEQSKICDVRFVPLVQSD